MMAMGPVLAGVQVLPHSKGPPRIASNEVRHVDGAVVVHTPLGRADDERRVEQRLTLAVRNALELIDQIRQLSVVPPEDARLISPAVACGLCPMLWSLTSLLFSRSSMPTRR